MLPPYRVQEQAISVVAFSDLSSLSELSSSTSEISLIARGTGLDYLRTPVWSIYIGCCATVIRKFLYARRREAQSDTSGTDARRRRLLQWESSLDSPISSDDVPSQPSARRLKYTSNPSHSQLPLKYTRASGTETAVVHRPFLHPSETQRRQSQWQWPAGATCSCRRRRETCCSRLSSSRCGSLCGSLKG
jgi:hypothetical protein